MSHRVSLLRLSSIALHHSLRCDAKYRLFWGLNGASLLPKSSLESLPLKRALLPHDGKKLPKGQLDEEMVLIELEDVEKRTGRVLSTTPTGSIGSSKHIFGRSDVLTTRLRPNLGKTFLNDQTKPFIGSTEWIPLRVDAGKLHPVLLKYYLLLPEYIDNAERLLSGKEHPRIAESDIRELRVPFPSTESQSRAVERIVALENEIERLNQSLTPADTIVDVRMCAEFGYPRTEHKARERETTFFHRFSAFGRGETLRASARFHHPDFDITTAFFSRVANQPLKLYLERAIRLGATATKADFADDGEVLFVHAGATKQQTVISPDDCLRVDEALWEQHQRRFSLRVGDIVMNRSGEGTIGKAGLWLRDDPALFADFTMRLRANSTTDPMFLWFYIRSLMFQAQVAREKRGMGNMTNIFPRQVSRMLVVAATPDRQRSVAAEIVRELDKTDRARAQIATHRKEILGIVVRVASAEF